MVAARADKFMSFRERTSSSLMWRSFRVETTVISASAKEALRASKCLTKVT